MLERLPDSGDEASNFEAMFKERGIKHIQDKVKPQSHPDFDGENCIACSDEIPAERLFAGRIRCTRCETILERRNKLTR